jgi:hypothetical protein
MPELSAEGYASGSTWTARVLIEGSGDGQSARITLIEQRQPTASDIERLTAFAKHATAAEIDRY